MKNNRRTATRNSLLSMVTAFVISNRCRTNVLTWKQVAIAKKKDETIIHIKSMLASTSKPLGTSNNIEKHNVTIKTGINSNVQIAIRPISALLKKILLFLKFPEFILTATYRLTVPDTDIVKRLIYWINEIESGIIP